MTRRRKISIWLFSIILISILGMIICDQSVAYNAKGRLYDNVDSIPHRKVGLILGTSPISTWNGRRNYYFDHRIKAGAELYKAGKVDWLVVSGGDYRNTENGYDEPVAMRDSLIKQGVDSARIILDYDGTRTLNSIAKMRDVYCQDSIILISQKYHNERALYQAKHLGIDAIGFNAKTPGKRTSWLRNRGREVLARVKLFIDVIRGMHPDIKESIVRDFTKADTDILSVSHIETEYGDLICLKPEMSGLKMDMVCGEIPSPNDDSIVLAFAGAFTGTEFDKGHSNVADEYQTHIRGDGFHQVVEQQNVNHRTFIHNQRVTLQRILFIALVSVHRIIFQQTMYCLSFHTRCLRHSFGGTTRGGGEKNTHVTGFESGDYSLCGGSLARTGSAGQYHHL